MGDHWVDKDKAFVTDRVDKSSQRDKHELNVFSIRFVDFNLHS